MRYLVLIQQHYIVELFTFRSYDHFVFITDTEVQNKCGGLADKGLYVEPCK
jgi:hypothetical protein